MDFPAATGIVWDSATVLQLTYHMINYTDSIVAAEGYLNVYYTPHQASTIPINTQMVIYDYPLVNNLVIPNNGTDTTFRINQYHPDSAFYWNVISILGHTHKLGVGYNVWTRNAVTIFRYNYTRTTRHFRLLLGISAFTMANKKPRKNTGQQAYFNTMPRQCKPLSVSGWHIHFCIYR